MTDLSEYDFARSLLGPVFADYLLRLHATIRYFERETHTKTLFVARAGIRIKRLLDLFCEQLDLSPSRNGEIFWISRLLVGKGIFSERPDESLKLFMSEYHELTLGQAIESLMGAELPRKLARRTDDLTQPATELASFLKQESRLARALDAHLVAQSRLFSHYIHKTTAGFERVLLVDTGWQGTAQRLLQVREPRIEWWGAYIGRFGTEQTDRSLWHRMIGLMFEQDSFDPNVPESSIREHRHLFEHLLEPRGPSAERLIETQGRITADATLALSNDTPTIETDPLFCGIEDYLRGELSPRTCPTDIYQRAQEIWPRLASLLVWPSRSDAELLGRATRSADFGKSLRVPVLTPPPAETTDCGSLAEQAERRIHTSLWPQGQMAIEFPTDIARAAQMRRLGLKTTAIPTLSQRMLDRSERLRAQARQGQQVHRRVGIITRTMDRPIMLARALESVGQQRLEDYEHIVVCDGGPIEDVIDTIENGLGDLRRTRLIDNVINRGMESASNVAIGHTQAEFIVIHDDDDTWEPSFIGEMTRFLDEHGSHYGGAVCHSTHVSEAVVGERILESRRFSYNGGMRAIYLSEMLYGNFFPPISFLFRRDLWQRIGGFDESLPVLGDWDFNLRILSETDIGVLPLALANYHHRDIGAFRLYGNSVTAGAHLHQKFDAIVRNRILRQGDDRLAGYASAIGHSLVLREVRETLRTMQGPSPSGLLAERDQLQENLKRLEDQLRAVEGSTFWRLTSPLRTLLHPFPRMRSALRRILRPG